MDIMVNKYDIIGNSICECLSETFPCHEYSKDSNDIDILKDFCSKEKTRVLFVDISDEEIEAYLIGESNNGPIYKISKYNDRYYFDWLTYVCMEPSHKITKIPIFISSNGSIDNVAVIKNDNNTMIVVDNDEKYVYSRMSTKKIVKWLNNINKIIEFIKKNDCIPIHKKSGGRDVIKFIRSTKANYLRKSGIIGLPYIRKQWHDFNKKYKKYLVFTKMTKTYRDECIEKIQFFYDEHHYYPSPFSNDKNEKRLGLRLWKYLNGCKHLRFLMFIELETTKINLNNNLFVRNLQCVQQNIEYNHYWIGTLSNEMNEVFRDWIIQQQARYISNKMNENQNTKWIKFCKSMVIINPHFVDLFGHEFDNKQDNDSSFVPHDDSLEIDLNISGGNTYSFDISIEKIDSSDHETDYPQDDHFKSTFVIQQSSDEESVDLELEYENKKTLKKRKMKSTTIIPAKRRRCFL